MTVAQKFQSSACGVILDGKQLIEMYFLWDNSYKGKIAGNHNNQFYLSCLEAAEPRWLLVNAAILYKQSKDNLIYAISCGKLRNIIYLALLSNPNRMVEKFFQTSFLVLFYTLQDTVFWYYFHMCLCNFSIYQDIIPW